MNPRILVLFFKYSLIIYNIICALKEYAIIIHLIDYNIFKFEENSSYIYEIYQLFPILWCTLGGLILIILIYGCWSGVKESLLMLYSYVFLLILLILGQFILLNSNKMFIGNINNFENLWKNRDNNYKIVDNFERTFKCCGLDGPISYDDDIKKYSADNIDVNQVSILSSNQHPRDTSVNSSPFPNGLAKVNGETSVDYRTTRVLYGIPYSNNKDSTTFNSNQHPKDNSESIENYRTTRSIISTPNNYSKKINPDDIDDNNDSNLNLNPHPIDVNVNSVIPKNFSSDHIEEHINNAYAAHQLSHEYSNNYILPNSCCESEIQNNTCTKNNSYQNKCRLSINNLQKFKNMIKYTFVLTSIGFILAVCLILSLRHRDNEIKSMFSSHPNFNRIELQYTSK